MKSARTVGRKNAVSALSTSNAGVRRTPHRDHRRWVAVSLAVTLHLAILALFLRSQPTVAVGRGRGEGAMDVALTGFSRGAALATPSTPARAVPPAATKPSPPAPASAIKPRSVLAIVSDILAIPVPDQTITPTPVIAAPPSPVMMRAMAQAAGAPGASCDIGGAVQTALREDPVIHSAVLLVPMRARSAANAVVMWNGQWIAPLDAGRAAALDTLQTGIRQVIAAAQPDCRDRELTGPRFMLIPAGEATMVLVFGNASWKWSDLATAESGAVRPVSDFRPQ